MTEKEKYKWNIVGMVLSMFLAVLMPVLLMGIFEIYSEAFTICIFVIFLAIGIYFMLKVQKYQREQQEKKNTYNRKIIEWGMPAILPDTPVTLDENTDFIFPALLNSAPKYFENWVDKTQNPMIDVGYEGRCVLQIVSWREENGQGQDIMLYFFPRYGQTSSTSDLVDRFKSCIYYTDFKDDGGGLHGNYGTNLIHALKVASYILTTVYYIPTTYELELHQTSIS